MSLEATCWALAQREIPLGHRMVLILLADCHCPDNGCLVDLNRLAMNHLIDPAELDGILDALEAGGRLARVPGSERIVFSFELPGRATGRARK